MSKSINRQPPEKWQKGPSLGIFSRIRSLIEKRLKPSPQSLLIEGIDPLYNMSTATAQMMFNYARRGNFTRLQYIYNEIELKDPTLLTCVSRRTSAISELDWKVVRSDQRLNRNADEELIKEQIECVETFVAKIDNLPDAVERLGLAAFRGFAHISPIYDISGDVRRFELIDNWNMCYNRLKQEWLWNPDASSFLDPNIENPDLKPIPPGELVSVVNNTAIDWPALFIYLRAAVGERDWGRFLETYGIPPVILTMPDLTNKEDEDKFMEAAESVYEGGNGVVPYGTNVSYASESRGTNPFTEFLDHQQKLVVLMATGGTLTSLAEAGSGTLAGNAQMDVWQQIVRRDVRKIGNAFNKQLCEPMLRRRFPGKPILAEFKFDTEPPPSPKEVLEMASTASSAGFEMDPEELSQACGYTIRKKPEGGGMGFNAGSMSAPSLSITTQRPVVANPDVAEPPRLADNAEKTPAGREAQAAGATTPPPAPTGAEAEKTPVSHKAEDIGERLVRSLQTDFKGVADELAKVLALPEDQRAGGAVELLAKIDKLVPDDPAMAEVIEEQMREAFKQQLEKQPEGDAPAANRAIPNARKE